MKDKTIHQVYAVGDRVHIKSGLWAGQIGSVDRLSATVCGPEHRIVRADEGDAAKGRFVPRNRLLVVAARDLEPVADR